MLRALSIRNLAIISSLDVEFDRGFNVLTGETGAGKSIIVGALGAVLGGRAGADLVRAGCSRGIADALFDVSDLPEAVAHIEGLGYDVPDGELTLSREVANTGKSSARISGRPATIAQLREIGELLVDIHGQHEHQTLLDPRKHMAFLDAWAGEEHASLQTRVSSAWKTLVGLQAELANVRTDSRERERQADLCRYEIAEIRGAAPAPDEEDCLTEELRRLRNAERLRNGVTGVISALGEESRLSVADSLASASRALEAVTPLDETLAPIARTLDSARYDVEEALRSLSGYLADLDADPGRLDALQERLGVLADLKRKYGATIEEVLAYADAAESRLADLERGEERAEALAAEVVRAQAEYDSAAEALSISRKQAIARFEPAVLSELRLLAMDKAEFKVAHTETQPSAAGRDSVEFLLSANPGEPLRPLARIASGGEISRVMLAVKSATSGRSPVPVLVFDEVDVGIGGRTAAVVGEKLRALAASAQVLCITHLAQIALCAHAQYAIRKQEDAGRTVVGIARLEEAERVEELARMLSGVHVSEAVRDHIRQMLARRPN